MKRLVLENKNSILNQIQCYLERNSEAKFIHRLQVIQMFADSEDKSCESLGALFGNSPRSISNWIKKVNQTGNIESLRGNSQLGRPSRLTASQKDELRVVLQSPPEKYGTKGKKWSGINLSTYISEKYGVKANIRSCQRLIQVLSAII